MTIICATLETIRKLANEYMQNLDRRSDDWVALTNHVHHDGSMNEHIKDKVVMTLYNITRENVVSAYTPTRDQIDSPAVVNPPIYIDLHLVFMANFTTNNYSSGLSAIDTIISFFQQHPIFDKSNAPGLGLGIDKITLEMLSPDLVEVTDVMSMLGTKYLPSVFYKMRMLPFS